MAHVQYTVAYVYYSNVFCNCTPVESSFLAWSPQASIAPLMSFCVACTSVHAQSLRRTCRSLLLLFVIRKSRTPRLKGQDLNGENDIKIPFVFKCLYRVFDCFVTGPCWEHGQKSASCRGEKKVTDAFRFEAGWWKSQQMSAVRGDREACMSGSGVVTGEL